MGLRPVPRLSGARDPTPERDAHAAHTDSNLETRWEEVVGPLARSFRRQIVLGDDAPIGRFDQVHVDRPLVVEIHSEKHHTMPSDVADDEDRADRLVEAGFAVVIYWEHDIWHDAPIVRSTLRAILARPHEARIHRPTRAPHLALPVPGAPNDR